jgi:predicted N-acetyltransferase YhbS
VTTIRPERTEDAPRIRHVNELAFGQPAEANLVERVRQAHAMVGVSGVAKYSEEFNEGAEAACRTISGR